MGSRFYMSFQILLYVATLYFMGRWSLRCNRLASRVVVLGAGTVLLMLNEVIAAFLSPIFSVLLMTAVVVFFITLVFMLLTGHSFGSIFQHFNIFRR